MKSCPRRLKGRLAYVGLVCGLGLVYLVWAGRLPVAAVLNLLGFCVGLLAGLVAKSPEKQCEECGGDPWLTECTECGERDCPSAEPLHYHHDGCPSCDVRDYA